MAIKTFTTGELLTASDTNTYLANSGLVYITAGSATSGATLSVNNCFTSTYDNYRVHIWNFQPATAGAGLNIRMRAAGTDASGTDYNYSLAGLYVDGSNSQTYATNQTTAATGLYNSANSIQVCSATLDIFNPAKANRTFINVNASLYNGQFGFRNGIVEHNLLTAYDGFTLLPSTGNFTNIQYQVYGYRQA